MVSEKRKEGLESRQYRIVGNHSAVRVCKWLKESLRGNGHCYKQQFYGIKSHRCLQMTPALTCNHRCKHCWRDNSHFSTEFEEAEDSPEEIVDKAIEKHRELLSGFGGNDEVSEERLEEAMNPNQAAISLTGEPTMYPDISELIKEFHSRGFTTFLVTNGTLPEQLKSLEELPTNLYISLEAPDEELYKELDNPVEEGAWEKLQETLEFIKEADTTTVCRITCIEGFNMDRAKDFAEIVDKAEFKYIEAKGYMHVGYSMNRLPRDAMPGHEKVKEFAEELEKYSSYRIKDHDSDSRVFLLERE